MRNYLVRQAEHHKKEDFKSELLRLLRAHEVEFEERYVFVDKLGKAKFPLPLRRRIVR